MHAEHHHITFHSLEEELDALPALSHHVHALFTHFVHLTLRHTPFKIITVKLYIPQTYPDDTVSVQLQSSTLPHDVLERIREASTAQLSKSQLGAVYHVVNTVNTILASNRFLTCSDEIHNIKHAFPKQARKLNEAKGIIKLKLQQELYTFNVKITVPNEYPAQQVSYSFGKTNIPGRYLQVLEARLNNILTHLKTGYKFNPTETKEDEDSSGINTADLLEIRRDLKYLEEAKDLQSHNDDKAARRALRRVVKRETLHDEILDEPKEHLEIGNEDSIDKSLGPVVEAILEFTENFPNMRCQKCEKLIIPKDPEKLRLLEPQSSKYPEQAHCGDWLHYKCLRQLLTRPPFLKMCGICGKRLTHTKWESDIAKLERHWAAEQARKRELSDVVDFLGLQDFA